MFTLDIKDGQWLNAPAEFEITNHSLTFTSMPYTDFWQRTNYGYSDWAVAEEGKTNEPAIWYRLTRKHNDFLTEVSRDGNTFRQMRMSHLLKGSHGIQFGLYACSPKDSSFQTVFSCMKLEPSVWSGENHI
ncbi:DUF1349 domain-containing protein [Metabacillus sp. JX24]|uniref:DUF1349 domain-containing protein n=1 Tax=Metabacillus sp. JX24 TaxID=3240759 RepID=UPI003510CDB2